MLKGGTKRFEVVLTLELSQTDGGGGGGRGAETVSTL